MHSGNEPQGSDADEFGSDAEERFGQLFHLIGDAVVEFELVDRTPVVRATNPAFEEIFGYDRERVRGESLNEFIIPDEHDGQAESFDERTARGEENHAIVNRQTASGVREFLYRGVPYERQSGQFGFAIYSDITEQRRYEQHIQVIHRILRHNLRNDLSVILGAASQIRAATGDRRVHELAEMVDRHAKTLELLGEETRTLEKILTSEQQPCPIGLATLARGIAGSVDRDWPEASVATDLPETVVVEAIPEIESAIEGLVENAVIHNTGDPDVEVRGKRGGNRAVLEIVDDGPGIPKHELTPLLDGTEITQLQHGSGLGLWLARCAVEASDGGIEYERTGDGRSIIRLLFPPAGN